MSPLILLCSIANQLFLACLHVSSILISLQILLSILALVVSVYLLEVDLLLRVCEKRILILYRICNYYRFVMHVIYTNYCFISIAIDVLVVLVVLCSVGLLLYLIFVENKDNNEPIVVGGKVPIIINEDGFNDQKVVSVNITLLHNVTSPVTIYHGGDCKDIDTITTILPNRTRYHYPSLRHHQEFNYYNDTPLYVLSNTYITYSIAANTNLSDSGCVSLYLFKNNTSFQKFLMSQNPNVSEYYNTSSCIREGTHKTPKNAHNTTFHIFESTFIYAGLVAGVNTTVEGNVSVRLVQYHPKNSKVNLTNAKRSVRIGVCEVHLKQDLCLTLKKEHMYRDCILAESSNLTDVGIDVEEVQYSEEIERLTIYANLAALIIVSVVVVLFGVMILIVVYMCLKCCRSPKSRLFM